MDQPMITPPRSPALDNMEFEFDEAPSGNENAQSKVKQFTCMGINTARERNFSANSYLRSGELSSVLNGFNHNGPSHQNTLHLFGLTFDEGSAFVTEYDLLTNLLLQYCNELDFYTRDVPLFDRHCSNSSTRKTEICQALAYIREYVCRRAEACLETNNAFFDAFTHIVNQLSNYTFSVAELPSNVIDNCASAPGSASHVLFHVHWDVRFTVLAMLTTVSGISSRKDCGKLGAFSSTMFEKAIQRTIEDLLYLAFRNFERLGPNEWSTSSPFPCTCVEELWVIVYHVVVQGGAQSFWRQLNHVIDTLLPSSSTDVRTMETFEESRRPHFNGKDSLFVIWTNTHLGHLEFIDDYGNYAIKEVEGNYDYVVGHVRMVLQSSNLKENTLRGLLSCLLSLMRTWGTNIRLCIELWEYFSRRFNDSFVLPDAPFEHMVNLCESGVSWCELLSAGKDSEDVSRTSSFFAFLRLLGQHTEGADWKSLKGRIYLKLLKVADLNIVGIYHVISVWITLALRADANDAWIKFEESFKDSWTPSAAFSKKSVFISAHVAFLLTFIKRQLPCAHVAAALGRCVSLLTRDLKDGEPKTQSQVMELGQIFVEGFQELVLSSGKLTLGQFNLIDGQLASFLESCGTSDRNSLLECFANLVKRLRKNPFEGEEIYESLSNHVVKNHVELLLESSEGCAFIGQITLYLLENLRHNARSFLSQIAENANVKSRSVCRFLAALLDDAKFLPALAANMEDHSRFLITTWFRIAITTDPSESTQDLAKLEAAVKQLSEVRDLLSRAGSSGSSSSDEFLELFLKSLDLVYSSRHTLADRSAWKELSLQYLGPIDKYLNVYCRTWQPAAEVIRVYRCLALVFVHCHSIIYTKGKSDNLLSKIVSLLILPRGFFDVAKPLPNAVQSAIQQTLHLYVRGLCALSAGGDAYISRCLKEIFLVYLPRFPVNTAHPVTRCCVDPDAKSVVRMQFLSVFRDQVISRRGDKITPAVITALQWLRLMLTHSDWRLDVMDKLLTPVLVFLLNLDEHSPARRVTLELVQLLLSPEGTSRPEFREAVERATAELIRSNLAFNGARLFKLLDVLVLFNPGAVKESFPLITQLVHDTEVKRGTGTDAILRRHVDKLRATLGLPASS